VGEAFTLFSSYDDREGENRGFRKKRKEKKEKAVGLQFYYSRVKAEDKRGGGGNQA